MAHHRRLRSDSHDPQRPGVLECGGCEGRSAPSLYCWYVWNGSLVHTIIAPNCLRFQSCNTTPGYWSSRRGNVSTALIRAAAAQLVKPEEFGSWLWTKRPFIFSAIARVRHRHGLPLSVFTLSIYCILTAKISGHYPSRNKGRNWRAFDKSNWHDAVFDFLHKSKPRKRNAARSSSSTNSGLFRCIWIK